MTRHGLDAPDVLEDGSWVPARGVLRWVKDGETMKVCHFYKAADSRSERAYSARLSTGSVDRKFGQSRRPNHAGHKTTKRGT